MKINITKKIYGQLLDLCYIARWMNDTIKDPSPGRFEEIEQYLLSLAKEFGFEKAVAFDKQQGKYSLTRDFVEQSDLIPFIDAYDNNIFWEELVYRLGWRDVLRAYSEEKLSALSEEERKQLSEVYIDRYAREFEAKGLENLALSEGDKE